MERWQHRRCASPLFPHPRVIEHWSSASNTDEALRAAALAMRHSPHQQASSAYDKDKAARLSKAAVAQAQKHAARFA